jgi:hypothetical protein
MGHNAPRLQSNLPGMSCSFQKETFVCEQKETGDLEDRAMEQDDGLGFGIGGMA